MGKTIMTSVLLILALTSIVQNSKIDGLIKELDQKNAYIVAHADTTALMKLLAIIGHAIMDIFNFSYWWSSLAGNFEKKTIFKTGIDYHFIVWCLIFLIATFLFIFTIIKLRKIKFSST